MSFETRLQAQLMSCELENTFEYRKWSDRIPYIKFPRSWQIKIIPPFCAAIVRFMVSDGINEISVYLDCYETLGYFNGKPYWEVYPSYEGDIARCRMNDVKQLIKHISAGLLHERKLRKKATTNSG